jgi:vitamin B12 transporter
MQKTILSSLILLGFTPLIYADTATEPVDLPEVAVTATRARIPQNELATGATVYTREDIERLQVRTLPDLLKGTTGLDMTQNGGGYGKLTSVFMRGTNSDHVLVLIDGIKAGSVAAGSTRFEFLPIDQIERVEIIRGPQSSLYGSEAVGGVIQIFTRKGGGTEGKPQFTVQAGGGSYDTAQTAGTVSGKLNNSWYNLGVSHITSAGFNATQHGNPDRDGYDNTGLNARVGRRFANDAEVEAFFTRAEGTNNYDDYFSRTDFIEQVVGVSASMAMTDLWRSTLRLGQSRDEGSNFFADSTLGGRIDSTRWNASWLNNLTLSEDHQWVVGSDYRLDEIDADPQYAQKSRYDVGAFTELHSRVLDNHFLTGAVRYDNNPVFGDYVTGNIGWRYNSAMGVSPFASFGNAFNAPKFDWLYYPFNLGNPNLKPEESQSVEFGLAGAHDWGQWEVRAYHTDIDNLIQGWPLPTPTNIAKVQIDGLETEIGTQLLGWNAKLNMSILNPENRETHKRLQYRTDKTLSFDVSRPLGAFDVGAKVLAQGDRFNDPANTVKVAGFVTVDLRTAYHINKNWMLSGKLNNLFNENYQTVYGYNTPDRNFFMSIHYNN